MRYGEHGAEAEMARADMSVDKRRGFGPPTCAPDRSRQPVRAAVTCDNTTTVACNFGRALPCLTCDVTGGKLVQLEQRLNQHVGHRRPVSSAPNRAEARCDRSVGPAAVSDCARVVLCCCRGEL
jgi:hypothetical protein